MTKNSTQSWYVYIVECRDGMLYTGITNNLEARISSHNNGTGAKFTKGRAPVQLLYHETCPSKSASLKRERAIKRLPRTKKLLLTGNPG